MTPQTRRVLRISARGSPSSKTSSPTLPTSTLPQSFWRSKKMAGFSVAVRSAAAGESPEATRSSSSSWRLNPGKTSRPPRSVPASRRTRCAIMRGLRNILSSRIVLSRASRGAVVHQCGIEPGTVLGKATEQLGRFGAFELAHGRQQLGRSQWLTQALPKGSLKQRLDMLDAPLASGRCFGWFNFHGHAPSDIKPLPARLIQQREVSRSREGIVNLNEVHPALFEIAYYQARLLSIVDREVIGRIVFWTVQDGPRPEDGGAKQLAAADASPPGVDFLQVAAHVAHAKDAIGDQRGQCRLAHNREVHMHVPEAPDHVSPAGVHHLQIAP